MCSITNITLLKMSDTKEENKLGEISVKSKKMVVTDPCYCEEDLHEHIHYSVASMNNVKKGTWIIYMKKTNGKLIYILRNKIYEESILLNSVSNKEWAKNMSVRNETISVDSGQICFISHENFKRCEDALDRPEFKNYKNEYDMDAIEFILKTPHGDVPTDIKIYEYCNKVVEIHICLFDLN